MLSKMKILNLAKLKIAMSALLVATYLVLQLNPAHANLALPGAFDCELAIKDQRVNYFLVACGDGYEEIARIKWSRWDIKIAKGEGRYVWNDCLPSCVDGKTHSVLVRVKLSSVRKLKGHLYFTSIKWWQIDSKGRVVKSGKSGGWNLLQNFKDMGGKL